MNTFEPTPKAMTHAHQLPTIVALSKMKEKEEKIYVTCPLTVIQCCRHFLHTKVQIGL
jgi:hypothetical protein